MGWVKAHMEKEGKENFWLNEQVDTAAKTGLHHWFFSRDVESFCAQVRNSIIGQQRMTPPMTPPPTPPLQQPEPRRPTFNVSKNLLPGDDNDTRPPHDTAAPESNTTPAADEKEEVV